jgi:c-di-GMP-binding flagellar brake protein YcgR
MKTHVQDISLGGLGALLKKFTPPETVIQIYLDSPGGGERISVEARVLWCEKTPQSKGGYRAGLEFLRPSEAAIQALMFHLGRAEQVPLG